jgi:hypothetical protein
MPRHHHRLRYPDGDPRKPNRATRRAASHEVQRRKAAIQTVKVLEGDLSALAVLPLRELPPLARRLERKRRRRLRFRPQPQPPAAINPCIQTEEA